MASGPWHYREGERLLAYAKGQDNAQNRGWMTRAQATAEAQAHFTAALAAATALNTWLPAGMPQPDRMDWWRAASGEPAERERIKDAKAAEAAEMALEES